MSSPLLRIALFAAAALPAASAFAADVDPAPDLRPSTYDFTIGVFGAATSIESDFQQECGCAGTSSGLGYGIGLSAGLDYVADGWVVGLVGDWTFGGELARSTSPDTSLDMPNLGTLRARAGITNGGAVLYATGGLAYAETEFSGWNDSDSQWTSGWVVGGGIEYAFTDYLSLGLEYLYIGLEDADYELATHKVEQDIDGIQTVRMGLNYAFSL